MTDTASGGFFKRFGDWWRGIFVDDDRPTLYELDEGVVCYEVEFIHSFYPDCDAIGKALCPDYGRPLTKWEQFKAMVPGFGRDRASFERERQAYVRAMTAAVDKTVIDAVPRILVATQLAWWWRSGPHNIGKGMTRAWTQLNDENRRLLVEDVAEFDFRWDQGKWITLIGFDPDLAPAAIEPDWLNNEIAAFAAERSSSIRVAIQTIGDCREDSIYVPHNPVEAVTALLNSLGLGDKTKLRRMKYPRCYGRILGAANFA